jgi:hypothetical protein
MIINGIVFTIDVDVGLGSLLLVSRVPTSVDRSSEFGDSHISALPREIVSQHRQFAAFVPSLSSREYPGLAS